MGSPGHLPAFMALSFAPIALASDSVRGLAASQARQWIGLGAGIVVTGRRQ
ncbi:MAG TPA: hypothetical protein VGJ11_00925 [Gaiellales bacterium]